LAPYSAAKINLYLKTGTFFVQLWLLFIKVNHSLVLRGGR